MQLIMIIINDANYLIHLYYYFYQHDLNYVEHFQLNFIKVNYDFYYFMIINFKIIINFFIII